MERGKSQPRRCAIYTRKSSEEGLEQDFNSLHAQREACEAFIKSQHGEGWRLVRAAYDDGGFSGGTMERPALQRLLADIRERVIDVIVVYKVDRLTRSLADFAKMVELFDAHAVSFVAVTQQFNTTSSMGRLTLNVLLSFAQFEREVTGERIRDKIAASKRRGMWMGGTVALGYDVSDHRLVINPAEAETVKGIFQRYLELRSVRLLKDDLDRRGIISKIRLSRNGNRSGGKAFSRGALYELLSNPVYIGEIRHRKERHPGQHEPIMDRELWERAQRQLRDQAARCRARATKAGHFAAPSMTPIKGANGLHPLFGAGRYPRHAAALHREPLIALPAAEEMPPHGAARRRDIGSLDGCGDGAVPDRGGRIRQSGVGEPRLRRCRRRTGRDRACAGRRLRGRRAGGGRLDVGRHRSQ